MFFTKLCVKENRLTRQCPFLSHPRRRGRSLVDLDPTHGLRCQLNCRKDNYESTRHATKRTTAEAWCLQVWARRAAASLSCTRPHRGRQKVERQVWCRPRFGFFFFTHVLRAVPRRVQPGLEVSMGDVIARHSPMRDKIATLSVVAGSRRGSVLGRLSTCLRKGGGGCTKCATENSARVPRGTQVLRQHTDAHQTIQCSFWEVLLGKQIARNKQDSSNRVVSSVRCLGVGDASTGARHRGVHKVWPFPSVRGVVAYILFRWWSFFSSWVCGGGGGPPRVLHLLPTRLAQEVPNGHTTAAHSQCFRSFGKMHEISWEWWWLVFFRKWWWGPLGRFLFVF